MIACLTQKNAESRFKSFVQGSISYNLFLNLEKGEFFNGYCQYFFELSSTENVFLDFSGQKLETLNVNGTEVATFEIGKIWKDGNLLLDNKLLKKGKNEVRIKFSNKYNTDGNGLHTLTDTDGAQYIYTQSEPYWANRVYPIFDQPDLKARMNFHILAPNDWTLSANTTETKKDKVSDYIARNEIKPEFQKLVLEHCLPNFKGEKIFYVYEQTPLLSTYLYAFIGGPYELIEYTDDIDGPIDYVMRILVRKSLLKYAQAQKLDTFMFCKRGLAWYCEFFQTPHKFKKYDIAFCPEFTVGAMEYPGVVTYTERLLFQVEKPSANQICLRGGVISHELAHMWFGNYVTMKWWDDLWLNESFADFVCYLCDHHLHPKMPFPTVDSWTNFLRRKSWGYREDQLSTTHPIACNVENTSKADSLFDGITYSKGASVIKQLYFLIGHETFSNNVKDYFATYGWKNASLKDFLGKMAQNQKNDGHKAYDLENWNKEWIEKAGLNQVQIEWDPTKQGKQTITLKQSAALKEHPTLRFHKLKLAAFDENCEVKHVQEYILEDQAETKIEIDNQNFKALLPNYEDWGYIKIIFDEKSLAFFQQNLSKVKGDLNSMLILRSKFDMIRDGRYKGSDFVDGLLQSQYLNNLIGKSTLLPMVLEYLNGAVNYMPSCYKKEYKQKMFNEVERLMGMTNSNEDLSSLKIHLLYNGTSLYSINRLRCILNGIHPTLKVDLSNEEKWKIVFKINSSSQFSTQQKQIYTDFMCYNDKSNTRNNWIAAIEGLTQDKDKIENLWKNYTCKELRTQSYHVMKFSLKGFTCSKNGYSRHQYKLRFFEDLPKVLLNESKTIGESFFHGAVPDLNDHEYVKTRLKGCHEKLTDKQKFFQLMILKEISDIERLQKCELLYK